MGKRVLSYLPQVTKQPSHLWTQCVGQNVGRAMGDDALLCVASTESLSGIQFMPGLG